VANRKFVEGDFKSRHCAVTELNARTEVHNAVCLFVCLFHFTSYVSEEAEKNCKWRYLVNRVRPSGHYMYRTAVTISTAQWSLYIPHSGHYMYRTVVTIRIAQWSLCVPHGGHYMCRTAVTICTAQWSLYVPPV
jgi:hypothetical protein